MTGWLVLSCYPFNRHLPSSHNADKQNCLPVYLPDHPVLGRCRQCVQDRVAAYYPGSIVMSEQPAIPVGAECFIGHQREVEATETAIEQPVAVPDVVGCGEPVSVLHDPVPGLRPATRPGRDVAELPVAGHAGLAVGTDPQARVDIGRFHRDLSELLWRGHHRLSRRFHGLG